MPPETQSQNISDIVVGASDLTQTTQIMFSIVGKMDFVKPESEVTSHGRLCMIVNSTDKSVYIMCTNEGKRIRWIGCSVLVVQSAEWYLNAIWRDFCSSRHGFRNWSAGLIVHAH